MNREEIKSKLEGNELIRMSKKYFDEETVEMGIDELVDLVEEIIKKKDE